MEYRIHTHASYATCETEDFLRIAGTYTSRLSANKPAQAAAVPAFFQLPNNDSNGDALWVGCQSRPMQARRRHCKSPYSTQRTHLQLTDHQLLWYVCCIGVLLCSCYRRQAAAQSLASYRLQNGLRAVPL